MQCADVRERLSSGELPNRADPHLASCERCAAQVAEARAERESEPLAEVLRSVQAEIAAERGPAAWLRSRPTGSRALIATIAVLGLVLGVAALASRVDPATLARAHAWAIAVYALAALLVANELLRPLHKTSRIAWSHGLALVALSLPVVGATLFAGDARLGVSARSGCIAIGFGVAVPLLYTFRALDRDAFRTPRIRLMAIAIAALAANLALLLYCPSTSPVHLLKWHAPIGLLLLASSLGLRKLNLT